MRRIHLLLVATMTLAGTAALQAVDIVISSTDYLDTQPPVAIGSTGSITTQDYVTVERGASVVYQSSGSQVHLTAGFHAVLGSAFHALVAPDTTPPTTPTGLAASNLTATALTLSWNPASDMFGVTAYEIDASGVALGTFTGLSGTLTGLTASPAYVLTVRARDAAGNWSTASAALSVTTLSVPQIDTNDQTVLLNVHIP